MEYPFKKSTISNRFIFTSVLYFMSQKAIAIVVEWLSGSFASAPKGG
ncbi:MAG: hypothetical protein PHD73_05315 [Sediminibacterium sp.]|nr:hypothetical protein [Sediminibacterium sp.]